MAKRNNLAVVQEQVEKPEGLTARQLAWLDDHLCVTADGKQFKKWREEAAAAARDTDKSRATMGRYRERVQ